MKKQLLITGIIAVTIITALFAGCTTQTETGETGTATTSAVGVDITDYYPVSQFGNVYKNWDEIGEYTRYDPVSFTNADGMTHYYELVEIPNGDVEWLCAAWLAQESGGYLVCPETADENEFVFDLIDDEDYWYTWEDTFVMNGPPVGGFQECEESPESDPAEGWMWLSGNEMGYTNWCQNLDDGVLDSDPRNNDQPNDATNGNQDIMCYGEITARVSTWGDFPARFGDLQGGEGGTFYAFVIEYETAP